MSAQGPENPPPLDDEPVGSIAEEAFKLFDAMTGSATDEAAQHQCSTAWCPVCRVAGLVREHPEAIASVTTSATALVRSLRNLVDQALTPQEKQ
ncbi:hypothetical protein [Aeromicrobium wangtongii]|uniref:hypothetical protein n=1 Tax=Aeromicrobium wangtongii TaxID=2969247 RepID=UPI002016FABC|nr:hypothetical protein [Aeromicrobium wangtongii]MCL3818442.1 hypothetical protein [Aeromicrobium wangtongii]